MNFTKELLLKSLAGLAICAGVAGIGIHMYKSGEVKIAGVEDLGLTASDACKLPTEVNTPGICNITNENINKIKFDGKSAAQNSTVTGTVTTPATLKIFNYTNSPFGYFFTLSVPSENTGGRLTINRGDSDGGNIEITSGNSADFKVKKTEDGFSLEKTQQEESLAIRAGLKKENGKWIPGEKAIKIKHEGSSETKTVASRQLGKIKAYGNATSYNQNFKFVIEDGDIALKGEGSTITKLEEFETYEIKKEGEEWLLIRKSKASEEIKKALGLPSETCNMPVDNDVECPLDQGKLSAIKFEGKGNGNVTITNNASPNIKFKISKTTEENKEKFPHGFKFVLETDRDISITQGTKPALTINANTNTEFKIKKTVTEGNIALTLERA